ncbi:MAG: hypothetical protein J1F23_05000 [Oscillospiraceae bacterium]|nr:hypothetical protein [Oscillospiraceae bacterium]
MKMKIYIIRAIKIMSLLLAVVLCVGVLQEYVLCHADHNRERIKGFYLEDKDSVDVVLIGASEIYADFSSCYAYEKFGFTSYPISTQSNIVQNFKTQIKSAIKEQHPKLIVVEVNGALYIKDEDLEKEANFRNYVDNIPLDSDKVEFISECVTENQLEYYLPIIKYHSVWNDFPKGLKWNLSIIQSTVRGYNYLKGAKCKAVIYKEKGKVYNSSLKDNDKRNDLNEKAEQYLRECLEYCKSENIDNIVFVRFPHIVTQKSLTRFYRGNTIGDIIAEYGYDYINFERNFDDTGLDVNTDFYNFDHLNIYGQRKFTEYFGRYIQENYGISESTLTPSQKEEWDTCVKYYEAFSEYSFSLIENKKNIEVREDYKCMKEIEKYL